MTNAKGVAQLKGIKPGTYSLGVKDAQAEIANVKHMKSSQEVSGMSTKTKAIYASGITAALGGAAVAIASGDSGSSSSSPISGSSANTAQDIVELSGAPDVGVSEADFAVFNINDPAGGAPEVNNIVSAPNPTNVNTPTVPGSGGPVPGQEETVSDDNPPVIDPEDTIDSETPSGS